MNESLLSYIDAIQEQTLIAEADVCNAMSNVYMKHASLIMEGTSGIVLEGIVDTIKNGLHGICSLIGRALKFIGGIFKKLYDWFVGLFKKEKKTADQIANESGIPRTTTPPKETVQFKFKKTTENKVEPFTVEAVAKSIGIKLNDDKTFELEEYDTGFGDFKSTRAKEDPSVFSRSFTRNHVMSLTFRSYQPILKMLLPDELEKFLSFCDEMTNVIKSDDDKKFLEIVNTFNSQYKEIKYKKSQIYNKPIKYSRLNEVQRSISKVASNIEDIRFIEPKNIDEKELTNFLNDFYHEINGYQMGLNNFHSMIFRCYDVDARYAGQCVDIDMLAKFAKNAIKYGMPPESIINNVLILASPKLRDENISETAGQSRLVLFPSSDKSIVYKIATSGFGISSNRAEYMLSTTDNKTLGDVKEWIALTKNEYENYTAISQERCDVEKDAWGKDVEVVVDKLWAAINENPENKKYELNDITTQNVGYSDRVHHFVALDYGYLIRKTNK